MRSRFLLLLSALGLLFAGCGEKKDAGSASPRPSAGTGPRVIEITAGDNMKFNLSRIEVRRGEEITVVLTNIGAQPKEVMGHNWVLLKLGTDVAAFDQAAVAAKETDYIPVAMSDRIIAHTRLLGPRKSDEVKVKVPDVAGEYPFLCSFPGHYAVGMKGVLAVQ